MTTDAAISTNVHTDRNMSLALFSPDKQRSLGAAFLNIRNYLAGRAIGITQDRALLDEVVKCLFCKLHEPIESESDSEIAESYRKTFEKIKKQTNGAFCSDDEIRLSPDCVGFIHRVLSDVDLNDPKNDPLSEAYQAFIGSAIRGKEGQFFTPTEAVSWLVEAVAPKPGEKIIDPACGAGSFLSYSARFLLAQGVSRDDIRSNIFGIDKDRYLVRMASTHLTLTTLKSPNIICADSIEGKTDEGADIPFKLDDQFDVVLANPPFGAKIKVGTDEAKSRFQLAHKWRLDNRSGKFIRLNTLAENPSPQTLFLELCIKLLKPGGRMGIVVPESMIANATGGYVSQFILDNTNVRAVIGMPESLFKTSGKGGTHTKTCLLVAEKRCNTSTSKSTFLMAEAKWCGHDSRGNAIPHNDLPTILSTYLTGRATRKAPHLGYKVKHNDVVNHILAPRYYDPTILQELDKLKETHDLIKVQDLVDQGVLEFSTGDEVGKLAYSTGDIPFVRTSDISNWEIKSDPKHCVSHKIYDQYAERQDVAEGDILMVKDGTYLIGTCAFISKYDTKIIYQSHLYKIRATDHNIISPYLLLAALSSDPVMRQVRAKRFTQDIIDSLGRRVLELVLPLPKNMKARNKIERMVRESIHDRIESRELASKAKRLIVQVKD